MSGDPASGGSSSKPRTVAGLILAAGESSRMGTDKALLEYRGRTFLETLLSTLGEAGVEHIAVVLGHHAELVQKRSQIASAQVVVNSDYRLGQTSSLQAGLGALAPQEPSCVVLCLVDHPAVSTDTVRQLIYRFNLTGKPVVIPETGGRHGHPVLLASELFDEILALKPGEGADRVIRRHRARTEFVAVNDPGIFLDVDDPAAYRQLRD